VITANTLDFIKRGRNTHIGASMDRDFNFSSCIHCGQCLLHCPTGALHEKHNINEIQEYLHKPELVKVIQYSPLVTVGLAEELALRYNRDTDRILNAILRKIGFDRVFTMGTGTDIYITEVTSQLTAKLEKKSETPLILSACPAWVKYCEQFMPSWIPNLSTVKSAQQITGVLIKTVVAGQLKVKPESVYSVSATPCLAMKFEARRDGMMRKGISDVDAVLTVRELARLIRLYGIDSSNIEPEPSDEPMAGRSSAAFLSEVSGGLTEGILRSLYYNIVKKEVDKQQFKKLRLSGSFREIVLPVGDYEVRAAVVDGLTGMEKLRASMAAGKKYDLVEVMTCPGGCVHGAGLPFSTARDDIKSRAKIVYQADDTEPVNLPCKSPQLINLYEKIIKADHEISDGKIFHTHFEKRNVLL
jgi:iron-only hydrogenase group A